MGVRTVSDISPDRSLSLSSKMGNILAACCSPSGREEKDKLSVSSEPQHSSHLPEAVKENQIGQQTQIFSPLVGQLDKESFSSSWDQETDGETEGETEDTQDVSHQSDTACQEDSHEEQKNKDESSVMVKNGSFTPSENETSDKDNEEVNEPVTQIELEASSHTELAVAADDINNVESE